jgi:hypothetical protein
LNEAAIDQSVGLYKGQAENTSEKEETRERRKGIEAVRNIPQKHDNSEYFKFALSNWSLSSETRAMKRRWIEILMGLAAIPSAATLSSSPNSRSTSFYINNRHPISTGDRAIAPIQQIGPRGASEPRLIFDTSDSRRALDDWELEDYVLVATIEGSLYALDRYSGATKWVLDGNGPAVRSVGNKYDADSVNTTTHAWTTKEQQPPRWIVQPVEGGQLFLFDPQFGVLVSTFSDIC